MEMDDEHFFLMDICSYVYYVPSLIMGRLHFVLIASAKSRSLRRASHQPAFRNGYLTISHTCLPCLPSERTLLFSRCSFIVKREVSWER